MEGPMLEGRSTRSCDAILRSCYNRRSCCCSCCRCCCRGLPLPRTDAALSGCCNMGWGGGGGGGILFIIKSLSEWCSILSNIIFFYLRSTNDRMNKIPNVVGPDTLDDGISRLYQNWQTFGPWHYSKKRFVPELIVVHLSKSWLGSHLCHRRFMHQRRQSWDARLAINVMSHICFARFAHICAFVLWFTRFVCLCISTLVCTICTTHSVARQHNGKDVYWCVLHFLLSTPAIIESTKEK